MDFFLVVGIITLVTLCFIVEGWLIMSLWNWLVVYLFGLPTITIYMAIGLIILSNLLFGSIKRVTGGKD